MTSLDTLNLVTLNTWKNGGDYVRRLSLMAEKLAALAPDLVFLQEVFVAAETRAHTGDALAAALGMAQIHEPARTKRRRHGGASVESSSGLSILSRQPIHGHERLALSPDSDGEKIAIVSWLEWNGRPLAVVNLHLSYQPDVGALRCQQLKEIVQHVGHAHPADAVILAGDFNAEPDSPPLRWLRMASGYSVRDAWDAAGGPQATMTEPPGSAIFGKRCIDHIMLLQPLDCSALRFVGAERVLDRVDPESGILPSDHAGLRAVLSQGR